MGDYITHQDMMGIPAWEMSDFSKLAANPVVSVILTTYNHEKYAAQAIEGVIMQQCDFPIELLIGEDCSTDRTLEVCREYQRRYPQIIRLITSEANVGAHQNYFRQHARTRGRYLALCDGDDYWTQPLKLQKQVEFLEANPEHTLCFHNAHIVYEEGRAKPHLFNLKGLSTVTVREIIEWDWIIPTASIVVPRAAITMLPATFYSFPSGDLPLSILCASAGKVHYFDECMSVYRKQQGGVHYALISDLERGLKHVEGENSMLESLDRTLEGKYRQSFRKRIQQNRRRIDYLRLRRGRQFSPRLIWNSIHYLYYRSCWKWRATKW